MDAQASQSSLLSSDVSPRKFFVAGVEVEFPTKPYKCQLSTMNMVIRGLRHMTNTIIESPTGSGKTLSLICSTLAWQRAEMARLKEILEKEAIEDAQKCLAKENHPRIQPEHEPQGSKQEQPQTQNGRQEVSKARVVEYYDDEEEDLDDFQTKASKILKKFRYGDIKQDSVFSAQSCDVSNVNNESLPEKEFGSGTNENHDKLKDCKNMFSATAEMNSVESQCTHGECAMNATVAKPRVPKIFYGSRTHQQLQQVVRELRKTIYKDVNMTILSSREHTCIQNLPRGRLYRNKTEFCHSLLDPIEGGGCIYNNSRLSTHVALKENGKLESPWDIEDLVREGQRIHTCPYFAARELVATADIVFCPYNYLIDPRIRKSMSLDLNGAIVLLDEAHNIEDACREAGSYSVMFDELYQAMKDCEKAASMNLLPNVHTSLAKFLGNLMKWMSDKITACAQYEVDRQKMEVNALGGVNAVASLETYGMNIESISDFKNLAVMAIAETNREENKTQTKQHSERHGVTSATCYILESLALVLGFMYDNNMEHVRDYYIVLAQNSARNDVPDDVMNISRGRNKLVFDEEIPSINWGHYLNFLCMNSGVVFKSIANAVRSIVLTSGTLAPLDTFNSELGVTFTNELQALHIVDDKQVWVGTLGVGPTGKELHAGYRFTDSSDFRQELGKTILQVCETVPYGVLCFLPSYSLLENLKQHWCRSGIWEELQMHKEVLCEIRGNKDFLPTVEAFNDSVKQCELGFSKGPLLFAVLRGKISEGLDFADNRARGVITVGIPYPYIFDSQVSLKRKYNDANVKCGLKSGAQWYETQAYRALNQALGRCIRHRHDWGALIIIDKRFITERRHVEGLSKWIRRKVQPYATFEKFHCSLKNFVEYHSPAQGLQQTLTVA